MANKRSSSNLSDSRRLLFSWIGEADLLAWSAAGGETAMEAVKKLLGKPPRQVEGTGPVKTLTEQIDFDAIHLLSDKDPAELAHLRWTG